MKHNETGYVGNTAAVSQGVAAEVAHMCCQLLVRFANKML